ncbi:MAG: Transcriptional regulator, Crp/Fnr family [Candidatus Gottesmanbacteria bacterium GW2011_GWA2_47_9]|uniref:Transcriptional regulator, Crp/Fnr family n=1 Tax=Candidatus Gottesmanbacteria bacterium GW2011_GWA2_47_9 TaxID=1618445 RepID=A0A0G1TZX6_9BACT|nr:MAG: Transcriptional regulator, Crp/Fnr family [Candidatus Gottesmanbacteria bacterium GW2011_GWA2_47_9]
MKFARGEAIIRPGEQPDGVYFLTKGLVRQEAISPKGEIFIINVFRPGAYFPMMWGIANVANGYHYEAATAAEVHCAPRDAVVSYLKDHPEELWRFTKRLLTGISGLISRFEYLMFDTAYRKAILLLLYFARRFGQKEDGKIVIPVSLAHREIASWIGTTRETASIQMEALKKKGFIITRGRQIVIKSLAQLEKEAA